MAAESETSFSLAETERKRYPLREMVEAKTFGEV